MAINRPERPSATGVGVRSALGLAATIALAAPAFADEEPKAPYVPTAEEDVELMLDVAGVGAGDYVIDLGSGDGRIVIAAAGRGARGHGVEIEPGLVARSRANAREAGVADRVAFLQGDIFEADIARATVVTLYLYPEVNIALRPKLLAELAPGTRVVSNSFDMGEWPPDVHDLSARSSGGVLMWIVPADVAGTWRLEIEGEASPHRLHVGQQYQRVNLRLESSGAPAWEVEDAALYGERIAFRAVRGSATYVFSGRVDADASTGYVLIRDAAGERVERWRAVR